MEWISIQHKLPNDLQECLFIWKPYNRPHLLSGHWDNLNKTFVGGTLSHFLLSVWEQIDPYLTFKKKTIIAWMPLPQLPNTVANQENSYTLDRPLDSVGRPSVAHAYEDFPPPFPLS